MAGGPDVPATCVSCIRPTFGPLCIGTCHLRWKTGAVNVRAVRAPPEAARHGFRARKKTKVRPDNPATAPACPFPLLTRYQESGRAGRDGLTSQCVLFVSFELLATDAARSKGPGAAAMQDLITTGTCRCGPACTVCWVCGSLMLHNNSRSWGHTPSPASALLSQQRTCVGAAGHPRRQTITARGGAPVPMLSLLTRP